MAKNNTTKYSKVSKSLIKKQIDIRSVLDVLDIPRKIQSGRISILCPCHNDEHFGSCFIVPKQQSFYCYACHAHGDVIDLVKFYLHLDFQSTLEWFANNFSGSFEYSDENLKTIKRANQKKAIVEKLMLSNEQLKLLGLVNNPIFETKKYCGYCPESSTGPKETHILDHDVWILQKMVIKNPWRKLFMENFDQYKYIVNNAIISKVKETLYCWELFKKGKYSPNNKTSYFLTKLFVEEQKGKGKKRALAEVKDSVRNAILTYLSLWVVDNDNPHFHKSNIKRPNIKNSVALYELFVEYGLV